MLAAFLSDEDFDFECNLCGDELTFVSQCGGCSDENDFCVNRTFSFFITDLRNGSYVLTKTQGTASTTGEDSASNNAVWRSLFSFTFNRSWFDGIDDGSDEMIQVLGSDISLGGVVCDEFIFDPLSCITIDCRNIDNDLYWDCTEDPFVLFEDTSHFMHGVFGGQQYCNDAVDALSEETMMAAAGRSPIRLPKPPNMPEADLFPELSLFPFKRS